MTMRLWLADFIKSLIISTIMMSLVIFAGLWLIQWSPNYWWFWVWSFFFVFSIFIMYISPYVIEPLFNKFTPIEDESLKDKIIRLAEKAGIHASRIFRIDASKRSRHTNAYFTGIGRVKRIVLYDTLLEGMNHDEIIAVLAHETGHWKKKHLLKTLAAFEIFSLISLYVSYRLVQSDFLLTLFNVSANTIFAKFIILAFLGGILSIALQPVVNFFSRRHERQADRASYELANDAESMVSALVKLSKENLSNLYPHPLYAALYYSHPPVVERIKTIKSFAR
jgi:STE24 endopeptidase